jgi:hypothetical protein
MVLNMKKLAIVLSGVLFSTFVYADKPLNVQSGYSMPALESGQSANERAIPLAEKNHILNGRTSEQIIPLHLYMLITLNKMGSLVMILM